MSRESHETLQGAETVENARRPCSTPRYREWCGVPARSETRCMHPSISHGSREISHLTWTDGVEVRKGNLEKGYR